MKKIYKHLISLAIVAFLLTPVFALQVSAQADFGLNEVNNGLDNSLANRDPREIVGSIINVALGFLGVIAVVIILMGGFKWMTAGGNEEKVTKAKSTLTKAIIGLIIIVSAYAIWEFIFLRIVFGSSGPITGS